MNIKLNTDKAKVPVYSSANAAGADLYTTESYTIQPNEICYINSHVSMEIPDNHFGLLTPRSSLCLKKHLDMPNSVGVIDEDYRGEVQLTLRNIGNEPVIIEEGERIAQIVFVPYVKAQFNVVDKLSETKRGEGGFGSTGK